MPSSASQRQFCVEKIVSGGQTGVDRAALDLARGLGIPHGGWCPLGRKAEDGPLAECYLLRETPSATYAQRTRWNVRDSGGTLLVTQGRPRGGTALTLTAAKKMHRPLLTVDLNSEHDPAKVRKWLAAQKISVLNVAGPRESERPGIYEAATDFLRLLLAPCDRP